MPNKTKKSKVKRSNQAADSAASTGTSGPPPKLSRKAHEEFQLLQARVQNLTVAKMIWEWLLTDDEKALFRNSLKIAWKKCESTLGIATFAWKCSPGQALLRIYRELGDLPAAKLRWLERELGESSDFEKSPNAEERPDWRKHEGRLYWNNVVIRVIRSVLKATNIVHVLDAFQANNWCACVENPPQHWNDQDLRETVRSLNTGLTQIRFETVGMQVRWRRADSRARPISDTWTRRAE
jgi:hypothetical protein